MIFINYNLSKICFMAQDMTVLLYISWMLEKNVYFLCCWVECSMSIMPCLWKMLSSFMPLIIFFPVTLPLKKEVLVYSTIIVDFSVSPFSFISYFFPYFIFLFFVHKHLGLLYFFGVLILLLLCSFVGFFCLWWFSKLWSSIYLIFLYHSWIYKLKFLWFLSFPLLPLWFGKKKKSKLYKTSE